LNIDAPRSLHRSAAIRPPFVPADSASAALKVSGRTGEFSEAPQNSRWEASSGQSHPPAIHEWNFLEFPLTTANFCRIYIVVMMY